MDVTQGMFKLSTAFHACTYTRLGLHVLAEFGLAAERGCELAVPVACAG